MIGRILKIALLMSLAANNLFGQTTDLSVLSQPNIVYGVGEAHNKNKADKLAFIDLGSRLQTSVQVKTTLNSDNENIDFSSSVISNTMVRIHNAKQICVKEGRMWVVYEYLDLDSQYCGYEIEYNPTIEENNTYIVAPNYPMRIIPSPLPPNAVIAGPRNASRPQPSPSNGGMPRNTTPRNGNSQAHRR